MSFTSITENSRATPGLWNTRFQELDTSITVVATSVTTITNSVVSSSLSASLGWYNVVNYGADPTGVASASSRIQACIDAAPNGATIFFPSAATFLVTGGVASSPLLSGRRDLTFQGYGSTIKLSGVSTFGLRFASRNTDIGFFGLSFIGSGVSTDQHCGIGTVVTPGGTIGGQNIAVIDCSFDSMARGVYFDVVNLADWQQIFLRGCRASRATGIASGTGYGLVFSGVYNSSVEQCFAESCQRHGIYMSACQNISVVGNTLRNHRDTSGNSSQLGALEIARCSYVAATGNTFDTCSDGAVDIEQDDVNTTRASRGIIVANNSFFSSLNQDIYIGTPGPASAASLSDVIVAGNIFQRPGAATNTVESIRVFSGHGVLIDGNSWFAANAYTGTYIPLFLGGSGITQGYLDRVRLTNNRVVASATGGGIVYFAGWSDSIATDQTTGRITIADNDLAFSGNNGLIFESTGRTNPNIGLRGNTVRDSVKTLSGPAYVTNQPWSAISGMAVDPSYRFYSEDSLGWFRSGASTMALSYGTLRAPEIWATSGVSIGNSVAGGTLIPAISSVSSKIGAFVVQGSASSFTVVTWAAVRPGDQIVSTIQPDAAVSSISSGLVLHSHCTQAGQIEVRLSNVSTLAQNQSSKTYYFTRLTPF